MHSFTSFSQQISGESGWKSTEDVSFWRIATVEQLQLKHTHGKLYRIPCAGRLEV